ncbi:MAG: phosphopantetheine-binding protein [Lachnospiraceae bacterium]|nr:phosphopantetheine-binding protein [Lachnospiraceae bacterium]MCM1231351.1 phosphopantetheine-binding protein [Ruminococcus flavefaciens]
MDIKEKVVLSWEEVLGKEDIPENVNFFDAGGYSLLLYKLFAALKKNTGIEIPFMSLMEYTTIESMTSYLSGISAESV